MRKKTKRQFLKRPLRFMLRFSDKELREFRMSAKRSGLSQVEFGRRKILDIPMAEIAPPPAGTRQETRSEVVATATV